ncbi:N-acetylmuramoyl-L-alanine amidase [Weissella paramesenteroides]|uniref:N-acetylmuramoyl-L-alanine amidase n=1 Tax=Weissella paramesenteroides TaxID=1249 RepID=A0ABD4XHQ4_WEIPA|nr:lytic exoenzyme target recognition domain-containing protein [Weissella paramesenteroides]MDF8368321.1 N-acetylmuramoyl-L-alanine amidase [Weissella paramesenteroides]MDF8370490.1 N-acetylmuramoyl-L-alanine amidase [Weissella paramesenteroides]
MVNVIKNIVVPGRPAVDNGLAVAPFKQVHLHSTGSVAPNKNFISYLSRSWGNAYYTHIVGEGQAIQVANVNGGGYDLGGDWNWEGYASIEFNENVHSQAEFNRDYKIYIELARQLAREAGITDFTLDTPNNVGIKTHNYASATGHGSDHVDPLPFLAKWGVSYDKLKHDIKYGVGGSEPVSYSKPAQATNKVDQVLNVGDYFKAKPAYRVDELKKVNGIWQVVNYAFAGGKPINWKLNGIGVESVDKVDKNGKKTANQTLAVGDYFRLHSDSIRVVANDPATNGVAFGTRYGNVWVSADTLTEVK